MKAALVLVTCALMVEEKINNRNARLSLEDEKSMTRDLNGSCKFNETVFAFFITINLLVCSPGFSC